MKRFLLAASLLLLGTPAFAVCPSPLTGKDASGTTQNFGVTVDGSGNCYGNISIVDGTNAANKATVSPAGSLHTLDDNSAAALSALTSPVPYLTATAWNTNTYTNGQTNPGNADLHGAEWIDIGALAGTALGAPSNYGTSPGAVEVPGVNAFATNLAAGTAGTPSGGVQSVQGVSGGTPVPTVPSTLGAGATFVSGTTAAMTGTTSTQLVALVASNRLYITRVKCNNSSATATLVQIRDGSAGTVLDTLAAGATYGGEQGTGPTPLFWTTAGNALYAQDVTTGASVICTASGYSGL